MSKRMIFQCTNGKEHPERTTLPFAGSIKGDVKRKDHSVNAKEEG